MSSLYLFSFAALLFFFGIQIFETLYRDKLKLDRFLIFTLFEERLNKKILYLLIFLFLLLTQSYYLNYETIDWDTNSYLVSSQDILRGNLPYEIQWESKQVLFYYLYALIIKISGSNLILFKLINDLLLYLIVIILFSIINKLSGSLNKSFFSCLFYLAIMSQPWSSVEYSEIYSLVFISSAFLILISQTLNKKRAFMVGLLFSISTLINIGSAIFLLPFFYYLIKNYDIKLSFYLIGGASIPHLFFLLLYLFNKQLDIYWNTLFVIPNAYRGEDMNFIKEFINFLRSLYEFNKYIYLCLLFLIVSLFVSFIKAKGYKDKLQLINSIYIQFVLVSVLFYYLASHGYYHHLIFFIYFLPLLVIETNGKFSLNILYLLIFVSVTSLGLTQFNKSSNNLVNLNNIYNDYPLKKLSKEIDQQFESDYDILAFDSVLVLFYLDKPNFSYIVHPTNHNEQFITSKLINIERIFEDEPERLVDLEPDVIMCSNNAIIQCEIYDYKKNYRELDALKYRQDPKLQFYDNQTYQFRVFIKEN